LANCRRGKGELSSRNRNPRGKNLTRRRPVAEGGILKTISSLRYGRSKTEKAIGGSKKQDRGLKSQGPTGGLTNEATAEK